MRVIYFDVDCLRPDHLRTCDDFGYSFQPIELYDMESDPYQVWNMRDESPDTVQLCSHYMAEWVQEQVVKGHCISDPLGEEIGRGWRSSLTSTELLSDMRR